MSAPLAKNEARRLKVLWQYEVQGTVPEEIFDNLTELAARICEAPTAVISLIDENRLWIKSRFGATPTETSRDVSFCSYTIAQSGLFIVPDASKDPRFASNPMVTGSPGVRFYAGAPLITADGYALGTLCIIDMKPRTLRADQERALTVLAQHIVSQLELRRRTRELNQAKQAGKSLRHQIVKLEADLASATRKISQLEKAPAKQPGKKNREESFQGRFRR